MRMLAAVFAVVIACSSVTAAIAQPSGMQPHHEAATAQTTVANSASSAPSISPSKCASLMSLKADYTEITSATYVPADSFIPPSKQKTPATVSLPAFCRVEGILRPTNDSTIRFEVWMPISAWNGRFEQVGNGGFAGKIWYDFMMPELRRGFAIAATDDGHIEGSDQSWAIHHPEKVIDFGYRAVHETSVRAKTIVNDFYGEAPAYSYFNGCSDGGREAMMEVQRFPQDFNGIIAGAPANFWTHLMGAAEWFELALLKDPASYIPENKVPAIQAASLAACDALDGVRDGIIEDPRQCHFDPTVLLCKGADNQNCLTGAQVEAARKIYSGLRAPDTGKQIFPGYEPGAEAAPADWPVDIIGTLPNGGAIFSLGNWFFADMVYENPAWDFHTFNFDDDVTLADKKLAPILNSDDTDLRQFRERGGKLIQYHGWGDTAIAPLNSINYYESVVQKMGGLTSTQDFYRLFMVPGMSHCAYGPGPNTFGGILQYHMPQADAKQDIVDALTQWVEHGVAPDKIVSTKFKDDKPTDGVLMTRPLCSYPNTAKWIGTGSTDDAANFVCK
jgi:hypothetical protein